MSMAAIQSFDVSSSTNPDPKNDPVRWTDKIMYFYQAPIVRFYYHMVSRMRAFFPFLIRMFLQIFFVVFLALFSFVLLVDYFPWNIYNERRSGYTGLKIPITEIILHICVWSLITEEFRQVMLLHWSPRKLPCDDCSSYPVIRKETTSQKFGIWSILQRSSLILLDSLHVSLLLKRCLRYRSRNTIHSSVFFFKTIFS